MSDRTAVFEGRSVESARVAPFDLTTAPSPYFVESFPYEAVRELTRIRAMTYGFHRQGQSAEFPEKRKIALRPLDVSPYLPSLVSRTGS